MTTPTASASDTQVPIVPLRASDPEVLHSVIAQDEFHPYTSDDQHGNWLDCIRSRKAPTAPAEIGHRACTTCLLHWIAMKVQHPIHWDPASESIIGDDIAGSLLSRHQRSPYALV